MAYILGFIATDGNVFNYTLRVKVQKDDIEVLNFIKENMGDANIFISSKANYAHISYNSKYLLQSLLLHGITPNKSLTIRTPTNLPEEYKYDFLRGVIDGDGSIYGRSRGLSCEIYSASQGFISDVNGIMNNVGTIRHRSYENDPTRNPQWHISIQNNAKVIWLRDKLYSSGGFGLARKKDKFYSKFVDIQPDPTLKDWRTYGLLSETNRAEFFGDQ